MPSMSSKTPPLSGELMPMPTPPLATMGILCSLANFKNVGNLVIALGVGLDAHDHVWQRPIGAVS